LKPQVLVFDPLMPTDEALLNLEQHADLGSAAACVRSCPCPAHLAPRRRVIYFFEPALPPRSDFGREIAA
jgi:hypothetical protein